MKVALLLKRINQLEGPFKSRLLIRAQRQMHRREDAEATAANRY